MSEEYSDKVSKFFNICYHGLNLGNFYELPPNVVLIIPSTFQTLSYSIPTECTMWQLNLMKPDDVLGNVKTLIDKYKANHKMVTGRDLDYKVYDSTNYKRIRAPDISISTGGNEFACGIVECPVNIRLEYLEDHMGYSDTDRIIIDRYYDQLEIFKNYGGERPEYPKSNMVKILKKKGQTVPCNKARIIKKLEDFMKACSEQKITSSSELKNYPILKNSAVFPLVYPGYSNNKEFTYRVDGRIHQEVHGREILSNIIKRYREIEDKRGNRDKVLYFFSFGCNKLTPYVKETDYAKQDKGIMLDNYIRAKSEFDIYDHDNKIVDDFTNRIKSLYKNKSSPNYELDLHIIVKELYQVDISIIDKIMANFMSEYESYQNILSRIGVIYQEKLDKEKFDREKIRMDRERMERERMERMDRERIERERMERERMDRERIERERMEREQLEKVRLDRERMERERMERERMERERIERDNNINAFSTELIILDVERAINNKLEELSNYNSDFIKRVKDSFIKKSVIRNENKINKLNDLFNRKLKEEEDYILNNLDNYQHKYLKYKKKYMELKAKLQLLK
jgi:hypothetical protein